MHTRHQDPAMVVLAVASVTLGRPSKNISDVTETPESSAIIGERLVSKFLGRGDKESSPSPGEPDNSLAKYLY
ncbi:hypothetical protein E2C01_023608 [Portunus trituberculatus]|uniref:Uncharacterized protein n=1 Tax=Portunus trituberculatus TaxID=210409 RepID=A0A5B7EB06_PORTR|nr:hypothetical protein [Portunus trituberculatus]